MIWGFLMSIFGKGVIILFIRIVIFGRIWVVILFYWFIEIFYFYLMWMGNFWGNVGLVLWWCWII